MSASTTDCLFIGHNDMDFAAYEQTVRRMGVHSGSYRDLNLNFIQIGGQPYTFRDVYNLFFKTRPEYATFGPLRHDDILHTAIVYLGTYLHRRGYRFDYINSFQGQKAQLAEKLEHTDYTVVAILTQLYVAVFPILEIVAFVRQHNPNARIVVGGPYIATQVRTEDADTLAYLFNTMDADIVVNSMQGESTLVRLIETLKTGGKLATVPNIYYRDGERFVATPVEIEDNRLQDNMVDWSLFGNDAGRFADLRTAISCPFACSFCSFPAHAGKYQVVDVALVEQELDALAALGTVRSVSFVDDTFNVPPTRFKEFLKLMLRKNYPFTWNSHYRCQFADEDALRMMRDSGCEGVFLGIESANPTVLRNMNKRTTVDDYKRGLDLLNQYNILTHASFVVGFPGETEQSVQDTIDFIDTWQPSYFRAQLWYCEPITPIWQQRERYGIRGSHFEWEHHTMNAPQATDAVDHIFLNVKNSLHLPSHGLEFSGLIKIHHREEDIARCRALIAAFDAALKDKLTADRPGDVSPELLKLMETAYYGQTIPATSASETSQSQDAEFDF